MRKLLLGALLIGAANFVATGCIFVSDDDDNGGDGDGDGDGDVGNISLSWTTDPGCPAGATTAELIADPTDGSQDFTNLFNCTDNAGFINDLPPNTYDVFINITDDNSTTVFATSFLEADVVVGAGQDVTVSPFTILTEEAFISFGWQINEGGALAQDCALPEPSYPAAVDCNGGGAPVCPPNSTCAADGACRLDAAGIGFVATVVSNNEIADDEFTCAPEGTGQIGPLLLDGYNNIQIDIIDPAGASYYNSGDPGPNAVLDIGNQVEDVGTLVFDIP